MIRVFRNLLLMCLLLEPLCVRAREPIQAFTGARPAILPTRGDSILAGATVYDILLDRQGRLWAATQDGAAYLEGSEWRLLALPAGLPSNHVRTLLEGADGALWLGMETAGLLRWKNGTWTRWNHTNGLPVDRINALAEFPNNRGQLEVWAATGGGGVLCFRQGAWVQFGKKEGLPDDWIWRLRAITNPQGTPELWAVTATGLGILRGQSWVPFQTPPNLGGGRMNGLLQLPLGSGRSEIWVSVWGKGLLRWDGHTWQEFGPTKGFPGRNPTALAFTERPGKRPLLWVATYESGIASFDGDKWDYFQPGRDIPGAGVYAICTNPSGPPTLWLGTRGSGLLSLNLGGWRLMDEREGLPSSECNSFAEYVDPKGRRTFWFGTSKGLYRWESDGHPVAETPATGFPSTRVNALLVSTSDTGDQPVVWAGTISGLAQKSGGAWHMLGPRNGPPPGQINCLLETRSIKGDRTLWAGMESGLAKREKGAWSLVTTKEGLPNNWVHALEQTRAADGSPILWVGTRGGGVARLEQGRWTVVNEGLPNLETNTLKAWTTQDGHQWLWAGSGGGGLSRLDAERPGTSWKSFGPETFPNLPSRFFYRLEADRMGCLYASTTRGILRFRIQEQDGVPTPIQVEDFSLGDGLPSLSGIWFPSSLLDADGHVWFGTPKGAVVYDPSLERQPAPNPRPPHLVTFSRDGKPLSFEQGMSFRQGQQRDVFEFMLTMPHRSEDISYRTQLVGLEKEPGPWYSEGRRELTGLPSGRYTLKVWARDYLGRISEPLDLTFRIQPPPWRSPWALGLYLALVAILLWVLHRVRVYLLQKRNQELERLVTLRTHELATSNESLQRLNGEHAQVIDQLRLTLSEIKTLQGLIPICMKCKKIRDDVGFWNQLESYLSKHSDARFSHGYCPDCGREALEELRAFKAKNRQDS